MGGRWGMARTLRSVIVAGGLLIVVAAAAPADAQKSGEILRLSHFDSPASMSILEESTRAAEQPMMHVFNNLVMYKQDVAQASMQSIVPDLATSWSWNEEGTELIFPLRQGVKWHDGKPFTAADVKCTWDLLAGKAGEKLRVNPRKPWYRNLEEVASSGDHEVTFRLRRPQPSLLALLASGASPVYPCHVSPAQMRQHPIGTGPFKFAEFKPNEYIKLVRNPDYWKPGRPYLDGIEYQVIPNVSTQMLSIASGSVDMSFPYGVSLALMRDLKGQVPAIDCEVTVDNGSRTMIVNRSKPPFDNP